MSFLTQYAAPVANANEALNLAQHIINNVDIANGIIRPEKGKTGPNDTTQWAAFKDLTNKIIYFRSYTNTTLQKIDMRKLDFSKGARQLKTPIVTQQIIVDVTDSYKASS